MGKLVAEALRLQSASRDVFSSFQKAKMEAARRGTDVVLAFNIAVPPARDTYVMFVDDGNGAGGVPNDFIQNGTELLIENSIMPDNVALVSTTFAGVAADVAGFNSRGLPSRGVIGRVNLNNTNGKATSVFLTLAGHIRLTR